MVTESLPLEHKHAATPSELTDRTGSTGQHGVIQGMYSGGILRKSTSKRRSTDSMSNQGGNVTGIQKT